MKSTDTKYSKKRGFAIGPDGPQIAGTYFSENRGPNGPSHDLGQLGPDLYPFPITFLRLVKTFCLAYDFGKRGQNLAQTEKIVVKRYKQASYVGQKLWPKSKGENR